MAKTKDDKVNFHTISDSTFQFTQNISTLKSIQELHIKKLVELNLFLIIIFNPKRLLL